VVHPKPGLLGPVLSGAESSLNTSVDQGWGLPASLHNTEPWLKPKDSGAEPPHWAPLSARSQ
jgi:hypothetical protein